MRSGFKICYLKKKTLLLSGHQGLHGSHRSFSDSSVGKESACSAGDPSSISGSRRSPGEEIGYSLQYSWTFLVAQLVKNLPTMRETWVQSLGWEDPLEKGKATDSCILAWRIPWTVQSLGLQRVNHDWVTFTFHFLWELEPTPVAWSSSLYKQCKDTKSLFDESTCTI